MSNFDYVTYRPLSGNDAGTTSGAVNADDDDALLDVDATDVLEASDLTLRVDTEDESDPESDTVSLTPPSSSASQTLISNFQRHLSSRRSWLICALVVFVVVIIVVTIYCIAVLT